MKLNSKNAERKLAALTANVTNAAHNGILDGGAFLMAKLKNEVLNSPGNAANEGKSPQPPHEPSQGRFIRRRTGALVGAVQMRPSAGKVVLSMNSSKASYAATVNEWAKKKYGRGYMQIVSTTYRKMIETTFAHEIGRAVKAADDLQPYTYENNYPPA
jgi:hypothetical protein